MSLGYTGFTDGCESLMSAERRPGAIEKLGNRAVENNACAPVSMFIALVGVFIAWPSLKLLYATIRRLRRGSI